jgi:predicted GNAT family N-acyltransferase
MIKEMVVEFIAEHASEIKRIRETVFSKEQGIDRSLDFDGQDDTAAHVLIDVDGQMVGTGRLLPDGHIGRVAVLKAFRGSGLGKNIITTLVEVARERSIPRVFLGAQQQAFGFYKKLGFHEYGEPFQEAGLVHVCMEKFL